MLCPITPASLRHSRQEIALPTSTALDQYSFKLNLQVVNVTHPNSTRNTSLLAVFKAGDSITNLHTALDQYRVQVEQLQGMKWR